MTISSEINVLQRYLPGTRYGVVELRQRKDGGSIRVINGRRSRPMHRYPSAKTGRSNFCESIPELCDVHHVEVDTKVAHYVTQPETLRWHVDGDWKEYTPDRRDELSDGRLRIIEVKDDDWAERDPALASKLHEAAEIFDLLGSPLTVRTRAEILCEPLYTAVEETQTHRWTVVTTEQVLSAQELLKRGVIPFGDFIRLLPSPHPRPSALAMVVRRIIHVDMTFGLTAASSVSLVKDYI